VAKAKVKKDVTGLKIRAMLYERGVRLTQVAIRAGVTSSAVSRALNDNTPRQKTSTNRKHRNA